MRLEKWEDCIAFMSSSHIKDMGIKTLVVDTAGTMLDNYVAQYFKDFNPKLYKMSDGTLTLKAYGAMKNTFKSFMDQVKSLGINLIFICHSTEKMIGDLECSEPKLTGGSYEILRESADLMGFVTTINDKRVIDFRTLDTQVGKDCAEIGVIEIPHYSDERYGTFFQSVIDMTLDRINTATEAQSAVIKELEKIRQTKFKSAAAANKLLKAINDEPLAGLKKQKRSAFGSAIKNNPNVRLSDDRKRFVDVEKTDAIPKSGKVEGNSEEE